MDYTFLIGMSEDEAIAYCKDNFLQYDLVYTDDKKAKGDNKIVISIKATADKVILVVGLFLLNV